MLRVFSLLIILFLPVFSSCSILSDKQDIPQTRELWKTGGVDEEVSHVQYGRIINDESFRQGGELLILPFKPGEGVEYCEDLDKVSLMIVRGFVDIFEERQLKTNLDLIFSESENDARFVIDGYIVDVVDSKKFLWVFGKKRKALKVEGKLKDTLTDTTVAVFKDILESVEEEEMKSLARRIGQNIGKFIINTDDLQ